MNPARSFGPDLVSVDFYDYRVYLVGPLVGALFAIGRPMSFEARAVDTQTRPSPRTRCSTRPWSRSGDSDVAREWPVSRR
jgi:hypothetical protein